MVLFCAHSKSPNTTKIGVSAGTWGKPKMTLLVAKVPFWEGASKAVLLSVIPKSCVLLKTLFYCVFSEHSFAEIKECNLKTKQKFTKNRWVFANMFFVFLFVYFCCLVVLFFSLCLIFCLERQKQKCYCPAILGYFFFFVSPKGLSLKSFFSSYSVFFFGFPFVFPFKTHFLLFVHQPLFEKHYYFWFLYLSFSCLFLSQCLLVSFKQTFLTSHFWNPSCFHLWLFLFLFYCFLACFIFLPFCFDVGFVFGMFILFLSCFCFVSCLAFTDYENIVFLATLVFFSHLGYKVVLHFSVSYFGYCLFFSCVVCFHISDLMFFSLCLCCLVFLFF